MCLLVYQDGIIIFVKAQMVKIFNISSSGSTATVWLTSFLNSQNITAFHALRQSPFGLPTDVNSAMSLPIDGYCMTAALLDLRERTMIEKPIGLVHSYGNTSLIKPAIEAHNGVHFALIRNPISRINSQFIHKSEKFGLPDLEKNLNELNFYETMEFGLKNLEKLRKAVKATFQHVVGYTLENDLDNMKNAKSDELIHFEEMFIKKDILPKIVSKISEIRAEDVDMSNVKILEKKNTHVRKQLTDWSDFPKFFRESAMEVIETSFNKFEIIEYYNKAGYDGAAIAGMAQKPKSYFLI